MSALFDYITGKKSGREVELDASLEHMGGHLGVEMDDNEKLRAEIKRLREPFKFADDEDWAYLERVLVNAMRHQQDSQTRFWIEAIEAAHKAFASEQ